MIIIISITIRILMRLMPMLKIFMIMIYLHKLLKKN